MNFLNRTKQPISDSDSDCDGLAQKW